MLTLATITAVAPVLRATSPAPHMDVLMVSGFLISILTLLLWMHLGQSRTCTVAFAVCLLALTAFAFLQGAWPLGIVMIVWSAAAFRQRRPGKDTVIAVNKMPWHKNRFSQWESESPKSRTFESN
jgi:hypothetical protein